MRKVEEAEQGISSLAVRSASKFAQNGERICEPGFRDAGWRGGSEISFRRCDESSHKSEPEPHWIHEFLSLPNPGFEKAARQRVHVADSGQQLIVSPSIGTESRFFCFNATSSRTSASPASNAGWTSLERDPRFHTHGSLQMMPKYEDALFDTHRQIPGFVYTYVPGSNLRSYPTEEISYGNSGASR